MFKNVMFKSPKDRLSGLWRFIVATFRQYLDDGSQTTAAALTYQTLFAVVPLLTVTYAIFNSFKAFTGLSGRVQALIFENVVPQNVSVVQKYLSSFSAQASSLSIASVALLVVTAFMMLFTIEREFNAVWRIREPRSGFQRFLMYWAILTLAPFLVGLALTISGYVLSLPLISGVTASTGVLRFVPMMLSASLFTLIYFAVPNCAVPFRHALTGGVMVAVVFEVAKVIFAKAMTHSNFQVIYGAFAAVPLFLLWIYLSWTIILIGAQVVMGLGVFRAKDPALAESPLIQLLLILERFHCAHSKGRVVTDAEISRLAGRVDVSEWNTFKAQLAVLNLIKPVDGGGMVLSRDLKEISVWDLYRQVPFDMPHSMRGEKAWEKMLAEQLEKISGSSEAYLGMSLDSLYRAVLRDESAPQTSQVSK